MKDFIPYVKHHIDSDDIEAVVNAMESSFITQGQKLLSLKTQLLNTQEQSLAQLSLMERLLFISLALQ